MPTTSPDGIYYPESSAPPRAWVDFQLQAESVQAAITAQTAQAWTSWTPTWDTTNGGGFTSVGGSGFNQGFWTQQGDLVHAEFRVELASGFATDSGTFVLVLPVAAYTIGWGGTVFHSTVGNWTARNNSDPYHWSGGLGIWDATGTKVDFEGSWDGTAPRARIDSNDPIVWAAGDILSGKLDYRAA